MITLKVKTPTGSVTEIRAAELLEINGKPYRPESDIDTLRDAIIHMEGRVETLEKIVAGRGETDG